MQGEVCGSWCLHTHAMARGQPRKACLTYAPPPNVQKLAKLASLGKIAGVVLVGMDVVEEVHEGGKRANASPFEIQVRST